MPLQNSPYPIFLVLFCFGLFSCSPSPSTNENKVDQIRLLKVEHPDSAASICRRLLDEETESDSFTTQVALEWALMEGQRKNFKISDSLCQLVLDSFKQASANQKAQALHIQGLSAFYSGQIDRSLELYQEGQAYATDYKMKVKLEMGFANTFFYSGQYKKSLTKLANIRVLATAKNDTSDLMNVAFTTALCYQRLSAYHLAAKELSLFISLGKGNLSPKKTYNVCAILANQYAKLKQYKRAKSMLQQALWAARKLEAKNEQAMIFGGLVGNYLRLNQLDTAKMYSDSVYAFIDGSQIPWKRINADLLHAEVLKKEGETALANALLEDALVSAIELSFAPKITEIELVLAEISALSSDHSAVITRLEPSIGDSTKWSESDKYRAALLLLETAQRKTANTEKADFYRGLVEREDQKLQTAENTLETFVAEQKIKENALLLEISLKERERQLGLRKLHYKNIGIGLLISLVIALLFGLFMYRKYQATKRNNTALEMKQLAQEKAITEERLALESAALQLKNDQLDRSEQQLKESLQKLKELRSSNHQLLKPKEIPSFSVDKSEFEMQWSKFESLLDKNYDDFIKKASLKFSNLSNNDLRIISLVRIGLDSKEIAKVLGIEHGSVNKARYRIRKKLSVDADMDLASFLMKI